MASHWLSAIALSGVGTALAGAAALVVISGGRASRNAGSPVLLIGLVGLLLAAILPFAWVAVFGRP